MYLHAALCVYAHFVYIAHSQSLSEILALIFDNILSSFSNSLYYM